MKYTIPVLALLILISCDTNNNKTCNNFNLNLKVYNQTNAQIDSIYIYCNGFKRNSKYFNLKPNETKNFILDMSNASRADGDYRIDFKPKNAESKKTNRFGYYTNGYPLDELIEIKIENDTILFDYK